MERAQKGGADVAEVIARSGSELSVKVRLGETELVENRTSFVGMRVMKGKRVALHLHLRIYARGPQSVHLRRP